MSLIESTNPAGVQQATVEDITWGVDTTALLSGVQTPTAYTATLTNPSGGTVTLTDAATVSGNVVSQRIRAGVLTAGGDYTLTVTFTPSGTTNVFACRLAIAVPF